MEQTLIKDINETINCLKSVSNPWEVYKECRAKIRDYEMNNQVGFDAVEYAEYINYITNILKI